MTYQPNSDYCNTAASGPGAGPDDTFTYTLNGGSAGTVSVAVSCTPDDPRAVGDSVTVVEDSGFNANDVLANDFDPDGDQEWVASVDATGTNGQLKIARAGSAVRYQPNLDYCNDADSGPGAGPDDTFTYALNAGSTATVSVTVRCVTG